MRKPVLAIVVVAALLTMFIGCGSTSSNTSKPMLREGCYGEEEFCLDKVVAPLSSDEVMTLQRAANEWLDSIGVGGSHVFPVVKWHHCFFAVGRAQTCAAGWTESIKSIHVSTAEPGRTGPLVMHETCHARYCSIGDCDPYHKRRYNW